MDAPACPCVTDLAPTTAVTKEQVVGMGSDLLELMTEEQLRLAMMRYNTVVAPCQHYSVSVRHLEQAWLNHWQRILRMPAGGAHAGGAMQTGFEMELVSSYAVRLLMRSWKNHQPVRFGHSWELRSMEDAAQALDFKAWGLMNGKPIPPVSGSDVHPGLILAAPPVTATWRLRRDATSTLVVRVPLVLWMEDDSIILPPDDAQGTPFYQDPTESPGYHRDLFRAFARKVLGELVMDGYPMSSRAKTHLPREYMSDESSLEEELEAR